jgi:hypothetical protein
MVDRRYGLGKGNEDFFAASSSAASGAKISTALS